MNRLLKEIKDIFGNLDNFVVSYDAYINGSLKDKDQLKFFKSHKESDLQKISDNYLETDLLRSVKAKCVTKTQRAAFNNLVTELRK